eukprot:4071153-Pleurochrysis_carterae.AAC.1
MKINLYELPFRSSEVVADMTGRRSLRRACPSAEPFPIPVANMPKKVLLVLTSVDKYPDGSPTGWYLPEAVHPYQKFVDAGFEVEWASITGTASCDPSSIDASKEDKICMDFWNDAKMKALTEKQMRLADADPAAYDAVFFAGGFGVMWDFPESKAAQDIIKTMYKVSIKARLLATRALLEQVPLLLP